MHPVIRIRWAILIVFVALCGWLLPGITSLENDDDVLAFLPPDRPEVATFHRIAQRFGMTEVALVGLADGEEDLLVPEKVDALRSLAERIETLEGVKLVLSLAGLPHPEVREEGLEIGPLVPTTLRDAKALRERVLASPDAVGNLISKDGRAAALMVFLLPRKGSEAGALAARRKSLEAIRAAVEEGWSGESHFAGAPFVELSASELSRRDIEALSPIVIGVLAVASAILLGSLSAAFLNLLITGLGVGLIVGAHGVFGEPLTIVSSSLPVMMVALGGAFGVHILAAFQRYRGSGKERASAVLRELWAPVFLSGMTTSVAFFALLVMPQVPMRRFGVSAGIGVLLLLVLALLVLPALLSFLPERGLRPRPERALKFSFSPPLWLAVALGLGGIALGSSMQAEPDVSKVFAEDSEVGRADSFFQTHFGGSTFVQVTIDGDLREAEVIRLLRDLGEEIVALDGVVEVRSVVDPVAVVNEGIGGGEGYRKTVLGRIA